MKPSDADNGAGRKAERANSARRLAAAFGMAAGRVARPRRISAGPVWTPRLTAIAVSGLVLVLLAALLDPVVARFAGETDHRLLRFLEHVTDIGQSHWYLVPAGLLVVLLAMVDWRGRGLRASALFYRVFGHAAFAFAAVAASGILTNVLKVVFGRVRPARIAEFGPFEFQPFSLGYDFASFPSGHSTTAGAVTAVLMIWFPRWRPALLPLGLVVAATRIASRSHYPSDVLGGFLVGFVVAVVIARWLAAKGLLFRGEGRRLLPLMRNAAGVFRE